jgi:dimeric dUTPase (all-alpha-NTP-PPase superfamily)
MKYGVDIVTESIPSELLNQILMKMVLSVHSESSELLDVVANWKMHKQEHAIDRPKALEEYVDLFKFVLNLGVYMDVTEEEFDEAWDAKTKVIWERLQNDLATSPSGERQAGGG